MQIRPLEQGDLKEADHVFRIAFGTQFGLADPVTFRGDAELIRPRWLIDADGALGAFDGSRLAGSCFAARWGSFGVFGPLTVHPDYWSKGIGQALVRPAMQMFDAWGIRQIGLFTLPESTKHVPMYQKFGFWPQSLTALMERATAVSSNVPYDVYSKVADQESCLEECAAVSDSVFPGLDLRRELSAIDRHGFGDTVLIRESGCVQGFAACHIGKGSEAGTGSLYIKFGAVRHAASAAANFERLVIACEHLAQLNACRSVTAGINTARMPAYRILVGRGYRTFRHGVAMQRPWAAGYNDPAAFVIDDWR